MTLKNLPIVAFYAGLMVVAICKTCTTNDVCALLCINMAITYLYKK